MRIGIENTASLPEVGYTVATKLFNNMQYPEANGAVPVARVIVKKARELHWVYEKEKTSV